MKWLKRILIGVVVLVLVFVIGAVALVATVDPNDYKQRIESAAKQATGRELSLQGDIELSFFPWLGLKLGAAKIGNAEGFGDEPFAQVDNVDVRVALLPLLRGEVRADTVRLEGLEANLSRNAKGVGNWEDLMKPGKPEAPRKEPGQPGGGVALELGGVVLKDAAVRWRDAQTGTDARIAPINLTTGALVFGEPFDIDLDLRLNNAKPAVTANVNLTGEATVNPDTQRYALANLQLNVGATGEGLSEDGVEATLETALDADLEAGTATVKPLTLDVAGLRVAGQVSASGLNAKQQFEGELTADVIDSRQLMTTLEQQLPATQDPEALENAKLKLAFGADLGAGTAQVQPLTLEVAGLRLAGQVSASGLNTKPQFQGELNSDPFSPRRLMTSLGQQLPSTQDPKVLENARLKLAFSGTDDSAKVSTLDAQLDDTHLTGQGAVESFTDPKISFTAALDAIDLDRYMAPAGEEPAPQGEPKPPAESDDLNLPVEALRDLHMDGRLTADKLKASNLNFTKLQATITARDGLIKITPLGMDLYEGGLKGSATMDVREDIPKFAFESVLDGLQAGGLVTALAGDEYLSGTTRFTMNVETRGRRISILEQALNGNLSFDFKEGSISNSEIAGRVAKVIAFFKGQPGAATATETRFTSLTGSANIVRGVLSNNNLSLVSPQILAKGQGTVNVPASVVDYTLNIALNDDGKPRDNRFVPLDISGAFSDLNYSLALTDAVKEQARQAVKQELQEKEQELKKELEGKQQDLKKDLQEKLQQELQDRFSF